MAEKKKARPAKRANTPKQLEKEQHYQHAQQMLMAKTRRNLVAKSLQLTFGLGVTQSYEAIKIATARVETLIKNGEFDPEAEKVVMTPQEKLEKAELCESAALLTGGGDVKMAKQWASYAQVLKKSHGCLVDAPETKAEFVASMQRVSDAERAKVRVQNQADKMIREVGEHLDAPGA